MIYAPTNFRKSQLAAAEQVGPLAGQRGEHGLLRPADTRGPEISGSSLRFLSLSTGQMSQIHHRRLGKEPSLRWLICDTWGLPTTRSRILKNQYFHLTAHAEDRPQGHQGRQRAGEYLQRRLQNIRLRHLQATRRAQSRHRDLHRLAFYDDCARILHYRLL